MLETMRKGSQHIIVKGLFFLLGMMFVVWGVGDVFSGNMRNGFVATVGKFGITHAELDNAVRNEANRYQEIIGKALTEEEAARLGIKQYALNQLVNNKVTVVRAEDLNIATGKKAIAANIYNNAAFFNEKGEFDKERFKSILNANGFTEESYVKAVKRDSSVNTMLSTIAASAVVPEFVAREFFKVMNEKRVADLVIVPSDMIKETPEPSEADLIQFYNENQESFSVPEQRAITYISFNAAKIQGTIKPGEEELKAEYNNNISQYKTEESRNVEQYLFTKEEDAKAAYEKISKGDAKSLADNKINLGNITASSAPSEVKEAIFALKQGEVSQPVQSSLGWHIFAVKSITPEKTRSFEEVRKELEKNFIEKEAANEFAKFGDEIEDEFAAGKTMEDVAAKFDLSIHKIAAIDAKGNNESGKVTALPDAETLLPLAFSLEAGNPSALTLLSDNSTYAIMRVDSITPKRIKALDEVKGLAIKMRKEQDKAKLLKEKATEIAEKIKSGEDIKAIATRMGLKIKAGQTIRKPGAASLENSAGDEPAMFINELFSLKEGASTGAHRAADGTFVIGRLVQVKKSSPEDDKNAYTSLKSDLEDTMRDDIISQYISFLHKEYPVSINEASFKNTVVK